MIARYPSNSHSCPPPRRSLTTEVAKVESGRDSHGLTVAAKKQAMQEKRNEFFSTRKKFLGIDSRVKHMNEDIKSLDANIAEITQQEARDVYEQEVAELERQKAAQTQDMDGKSDELRRAQEQITDLEEKLYSMRNSRDKISRTVSMHREQMRQIENETDNLAVYGAHIPRFVKALERNKARFSTPPLGPIGRFIEVPETRYKGVIERLIGGSLGSFIVNTPRDHQVFMELFNKECGRERCPGIIQRKFRHQPYDTSLHGVQVPRNAITPLDLIQCKNTVVLNTIIDMHRVDQNLIVETMDMGRKLTENVENVPRNLKKVVVMEPHCEVFPQPNFRIYSQAPKQCKFIQVSAAEKKLQMKAQFEEHNQKLEEEKAAFNYTESMALKAKQSRTKLQAEIQTLRRSLRDLDSQIQDIKEQHLGPVTELDTLVEEKQRLESQLEQLTIEYAPQKAKMDELTLQLDEMAKDIQDTEQRNAEFDSKLEEARERVNGLRNKLSQLEGSRSEKAGELQEMEQEVVSQRTVTDRKKAHVDKMISENGERVRTRKTQEEVREEIQRLQAQREVSTQITETREEIMAELAVLEDKVEKLNQDYEQGKETLKVVSFNLFSR